MVTTSRPPRGPWAPSPGVTITAPVDFGPMFRRPESGASADVDMGRPAHEPSPTSRRQVEALAAYGIPEIDIAGVIGIDPKTLRKHYRQELDYGHVRANAKVAENLYRKAIGDGREAVTAAIFWLKTRAGWREPPRDYQVDVHNFDDMSDRELQLMITKLRADITEAAKEELRADTTAAPG